MPEEYAIDNFELSGSTYGIKTLRHRRAGETGLANAKSN
jgi:hypothetical protein